MKVFGIKQTVLLTIMFAMFCSLPQPVFAAWYDNNWNYRKQIDISASMTPGTQTNFPVLITVSTDSNFADNVQADGDDIIFTLSDGTTRLSHEIEKFTSSNGELVAWVKIPSLSSTSNTTIYIYYGNSSAANQEDVDNVWDSNFIAVWHLAEDPSINSDGDCSGTAEECDSTSNNNDSTAIGSMSSSDLINAKIGSGLGLDGNDDYLSPPLGNGLNLTGTQITLEGWARTSSGGVGDDEALINKIPIITGVWGDYPYMLGMEDSTHPSLDKSNCRISTSNGDARINVDSVPRGSWVYLVCRWDGNSLEAFVNNTLISSFNLQGSINVGTDIRLGARRFGRRYGGDMDELRISNIARSDNWLTTTYNNQNTPGSYLSFGSQEEKLSYFVTGHDGTGINCVPELVTVTAKNSDGSTYTDYTGTIVLDTQSGNGSWTLNAGNGTFNDATAGDGLADYTFSALDNGVAIFSLDYESGNVSIDVDAYEGAVRDDDSEGNLLFSPSGFTVTASALVNPPGLPVDTFIPAQTAASSFNLYLAAYGQAPSDAICGIIESYDGVKNIGFWSDYNDPSSGTLAVVVDGSPVAGSSGASVSQNVTFNQGQAQIALNYPDAGAIILNMRDSSISNPDLPNGINGASQPFVVKPARFVLSDIKRSSDSFANPGDAIDENSSPFMAAGDRFSVTVTALNSLDNVTPNYGNESSAEGVMLASTLVAAGGVNNPAIAFTTGFDGFVSGVDSGADFYWDEVGIITLTPSVADGDYLGGGDVTGTTSANIGRFYPDHFLTAITSNGSFANSCVSATPFTYLGESFGYLSNPVMNVTAWGVNSTAINYTGAFAKLTTAGISLTYPVADNAQLNEGGTTLIALTSTSGALGRTDNGNGVLTFRLGGGAPDLFFYDRSVGEVAPFVPDLSIQLTAVTDGEASAADLSSAKAIRPVGNLQRFGRGYIVGTYGTMSQIGDSLTLNIGTQFFAGPGVWVQHSDDSCSQFAYTRTDTDITVTESSVSPVTLSSGVGNLTLTITADAGSPGGRSRVVTGWSSWLRYDIDATDQLSDGNRYDDNPAATAVFGIFRGDDRYLYWREAP